MTYFCCDCGYELNGLTLCPECGTRQTDLARLRAMFRRHRRSLRARVGVMAGCWLVCGVVVQPVLRVPGGYRVGVIGTALLLTLIAVWRLTYVAMRGESGGSPWAGALGFSVLLMIASALVMTSCAALVLMAMG